MENKDKVKLVNVFSGEFWQVTMIQNILEENQIQACIENSLMGTIEPWVVSAGGLNPVHAIVSNSDYELAMKLIEEFNSSENINEIEE